MIDCNEWKTEKCQERKKYGESETTQIMIATVRHMISSSGLRKIQAA
jgi:hypothetical protein